MLDFFLKRNKKGKYVEESAGGSRIYRHEEPEDKGWTPPAQMCYEEDVCAHFEKAFPGRKTNVFHEIMSDTIHVDVYVMQPTEEQPYYVLYTTGMSDLPMTLPGDLLPEYKHLERAELMTYLPADWDLSDINDSEESYWPIRLLKFFARFPHTYQTWLGYGHSIPNGPDYEPFAPNTKLNGVVLTATDPELNTVKTKDGTEVQVYILVPVYREEMDLKLDKGIEALLERIEALNDHPFVIDPQRKNVCLPD